MLKTRAIALLTLAMAAAPLLAGESVSTYIVGTRGAVAFERPGDLPGRVVVRFSRVDAYAAELTDGEVEQLLRSPLVRYVEPVIERHALELRRLPATDREMTPVRAIGASAETSLQTTPWGISKVRAPEVWSVTRGATVRVAVIDSGIDRLHPELQAQYRGGYDFINNDGDPHDDNGHGTHVAGTIAALDNLSGVVGVAPNVELYALKVLDSAGNGTNLALARAVEWAIDNDIDVINMSLGGGGASLTERELFERAQDAGIISIAAAGNDWEDPANTGVDFPSAYPSVFSVGAIDCGEQIASFSDRGPEVDVVAPGVGVQSTIPGVLGTFLGVETSAGNVLRAELMEHAPSTEASGPLVFSGLGKPEEFPEEVEGAIALIERGELLFAEKATNAKAAGAIGVIIYNNNCEGFTGTLGLPGSWLPAVSISRNDGLLLRSMEGETVSLAQKTESGALGNSQGTSMATPHVAGIAALLRGLMPEATPAQVFEALRSTARDLGDAGRDDTFGHGLVDAYAAARMLAPHKFITAPPGRKRGARR
ncbi:MAG TPA: S8 family serine peptidase [Thermoanaerobaculia bacterium]|nr:S8 family serine peptidase [Thermoanaerobaculia bacterium]